MNETFTGGPRWAPSHPFGDGSSESEVSLVRSAPFATLSSLWRALRRRRRVWGTVAAAGVAAAVGLSLAFPPDHTATTTLFLQRSDQGDATEAMESDAELLRSRTVVQAAIDLIGLRLPAERLLSDLRVSVVTTDILRLTVAAATDVEAVRRARAVGEAFLAFRTAEYERQSRVEVEALRERASDVTSQLARVNEAIGRFGTRPETLGEAGLREYGDLLSQKAMLSGQVDQLQRRIDVATVAPATSVAKSRILDPASPDERSPLRAMAINAASGLVGGFAVGTGWIVLQELVSTRVRGSREVAAALRAPVAVTTGPLRASRRIQRKRFRTDASELPRAIVRVMVKWRDALSTRESARGAVVVFSVSADREAALFIACTAAALARDGRAVVVTDLSDGCILAGVFSVEPRGTSTVAVPGSASTLRVSFARSESQSASGNGVGDGRHDVGSDADLRLVFVTASALIERVWLPLGADSTAVAVVRAGGANADALVSVGQTLAESEVQLDHVVLVGADPDDIGSRVPAHVSGAVVVTASERRVASFGEPVPQPPR